MRVHLDFGHGGTNTGAISGGVVERDLVTEIGTKLTNVLRAVGVGVSLSRVDAEMGPYFSHRATIAKYSGAQLAVSLHADAMPTDSDTRGGTIYTLAARSKLGAFFGTCLPDPLRHGGVVRQREAQPPPHWTKRAYNVLRKYTVPAVLVELGYLTNEKDRTFLLTQEGQAAIVLRLAETITSAIQQGKV